MNSEHQIVREVYEAKKDLQAADRLISAYMPFIRAETARFLNRPPVDGNDDELSIVMIAFHEAVKGYRRTRGSFFKYASLLIKSRLIDYRRTEQRHLGHVSLDAPAEENSHSTAETLPDRTDYTGDLVLREATQAEIQELTHQMEDFGVTLSDIAENLPRQQRTLTACQNALRFALDHPEIFDEFLRTKRLPLTRIAQGSGVSRKTLERHRKYLAALLLIWTNGYDIIRGHLVQVLKGGAA